MKRPAGQNDKHCSRTTGCFLPVSTAPTVNVFETGITLLGRSEVSLAATTPCRLQLASYLAITTCNANFHIKTLFCVIAASSAFESRSYALHT
jgi:hypothetical protein